MKKKFLKKIIKFSLITLVSLIVIFALIDYFILLNSSKNINKSINSIFTNINEIINDYSNSNNKIISNSGDFIIYSDINEYSDLNGYDISYDLKYNKDDKSTLLNLNINNNDKIEGNIYLKDNYIYMDFPKLIANMIKFPSSDVSFINEFNTNYKDASIDNLVSINNKLNSIILSNINSKNISKNMSGLDTIITYNVDINSLIDSIINDEELLKEINKFNISKEDILKYKDSNVTYKLNLNILGVLNDITISYNDIKVVLSFDIDKTINNINISKKYDSNSIVIDLDIEPYQNGKALDGVIKFNMSNNKNASIEVSNITTFNDKMDSFDITKARSLSELSDTDLKIIDKVKTLFDRDSKK